MGASASLSLLMTPSSVLISASVSFILTFSVSTSTKNRETCFRSRRGLAANGYGKAATNTTVCLTTRPPAAFRFRRAAKNFYSARRNYSGRPSSARNDEADGTKASRRGNPATRTVSHAAPLSTAKIEPRVLPQEHVLTMCSLVS